jgi:hypothetical protein
MVVISKLIILLNTSQYYKCTEKNLFTVTFPLFFSLYISRPLFLIHSLQSFSHPGHQPPSCSTRRPPLLRTPLPYTRQFGHLHLRVIILLHTLYQPPILHLPSSVREPSEDKGVKTTRGAARSLAPSPPKGSDHRVFRSFTVGAVLLTLSFGRASTKAIHRVVDEVLPNAPLNNPYQSKSIFFTRSSSNL